MSKWSQESVFKRLVKVSFSAHFSTYFLQVDNLKVKHKHSKINQIILRTDHVRMKDLRINHELSYRRPQLLLSSCLSSRHIQYSMYISIAHRSFYSWITDKCPLRAPSHIFVNIDPIKKNYNLHRYKISINN